MNPLNLLIFFLSLLLLLMFINDTSFDYISLLDKNQREYSRHFQAAVDDTGAYLARLESQQAIQGFNYSKGKELSLDLEMINIFYENLALKFGVEGDSVAVQNIMMHIPAMVLVRYEGYNLVTLEDTSGRFSPNIWPLKPYTYVLDEGYVLFFTLDDKATLYDPNTNQFFSAPYNELRLIRDLSPANTYEKFQGLRQKAIAKSIEKDLAGAINQHMLLVKRNGLAVDFYLPQGIEEHPINNIGFFAFMQGYPLPGGEVLDYYSFGGGSVSLRDEYIGTIRSDGRHVAYGKYCSIPPDAVVMEKLFNDEEAVRKGYFIKDCQPN